MLQILFRFQLNWFKLLWLLPKNDGLLAWCWLVWCKFEWFEDAWPDADKLLCWFELVGPLCVFAVAWFPLAKCKICVWLPFRLFVIVCWCSVEPIAAARAVSKPVVLVVHIDMMYTLLNHCNGSTFSLFYSKFYNQMKWNTTNERNERKRNEFQCKTKKTKLNLVQYLQLRIICKISVLWRCFSFLVFKLSTRRKMSRSNW